MLTAPPWTPLQRVIGPLRAHRWIVLLSVGALTWLVYWVGLVSPYSLVTLGLPPQQDIAKLTHDRPAAQVGLALTYACLVALYYLAWRLCRRPASGESASPPRADSHGAVRLWVALLAIVAAVNLTMLSLYPIGAADIFDYVAQGREISLWGLNPFYVPAEASAADPVLAYTAWSGITTLYGPAWQLMAAPLTFLVGDNLQANVLAFKALDLLFYAGCLALITLLVRRQAPERVLSAVCLFALNPLVIYETAGNGHNDIVMVFWMLLGFYCLSRERHSLAALALTFGMLIKFVPGFVLPIVLAYSLSRLPSWRARVSFLLVTGAACGLLVAAVAGPFWNGGDMFSAERRLGMLTTSLPAFVEALLEPHFGSAASEEWVGRFSVVVMAAAVAAAAGYVGLVQARRSDPARAQAPGPAALVDGAAPWLRAVRASTVVLLIYLLVACLWFQGWYSLWPLSLAVLLPEGGLAASAVLLSLAGIWKPMFFDFVLSHDSVPPRLQRETLLGPAVLGFTWLFATVAAVRAVVHARLYTGGRMT